MKFVPKSSIDDRSSLVQVMAWCLSGDKPLPEPMLTQVTDAYIATGHSELIFYLLPILMATWQPVLKNGICSLKTVK